MKNADPEGHHLVRSLSCILCQTCWTASNKGTFLHGNCKKFWETDYSKYNNTWNAHIIHTNITTSENHIYSPHSLPTHYTTNHTENHALLNTWHPSSVQLLLFHQNFSRKNQWPQILWRTIFMSILSPSRLLMACSRVFVVGICPPSGTSEKH